MTVVIVCACLCLILTDHTLIALALVAAVALGLVVHGLVTAEVHEEWDDELQAARARQKRGLG